MPIPERKKSPSAAESRFKQGCNYFQLDSKTVSDVIKNNPPTTWAVLLGGSAFGGRAAAFAALALANIECAKGNHSLELQLATSVATKVLTDEIGSYIQAWSCALRAAEHLSKDKEADVIKSSSQIYDLSLQAIEDLDSKMGAKEQPKPSLSGKLDEIVKYLCLAEKNLNIEYSAPSLDYLRRSRNRDIRAKVGPALTFHQKHNEEIHEYWKREYLSWFTSRYLDKYKEKPPDNLFMKNSRTIIGFQIRPGMMHVFDRKDSRDFFDYTEAIFRKEKGLPAKGEKYSSQTYLFRCVKILFSNREVQIEARPAWLGSQRLDIYIPDMRLAIEYQGEQHYFPLENLGGYQGLQDRMQLDKRKRELCISNQTKLIEWSFRDPINIESVRKRIETAGFEIDCG